MSDKKKTFLLVIPQYPYINVYSKITMPPYGALTIATIVNNMPGWQAELVDENNCTLPELGIFKAADALPDIVGIYVGLTSICLRAYRIAQHYQKLGVPIIVGGAHVDALPEEPLENGATIVVHGEGEQTIQELLPLLTKGGNLKDISSVEGISFLKDGKCFTTPRRQPILNLDIYPTPDISLLRYLKQPVQYLPISKTRGCRFQCEFCCVHKHLGTIHSRSADRVFEDIKIGLQNGIKEIFCTDDNFVEDRDETLRLCKLLSEYRKTNAKYKITVQLRAEVAKDDKMLDAMWEAGIRSLCIGFESPCPNDLKAMKKGLNSDKMLEYARHLTSLGFYVHGMFIFGYPGEDGSLAAGNSLRSSKEAFKRFVRRAKIDTLQVLKAVPLPGTKLAQRLKAMGKIFPLSEVNWEKYDGNWVVFDPGPNCTPSQLQKEGTSLMQWFYGKRAITRQFLCSASALFLPIWIKRTARMRQTWEQRYQLRNIIIEWFGRIKREVRNLECRIGGHILVSRWLKNFHRENFENTLRKITQSKLTTHYKQESSHFVEK